MGRVERIARDPCDHAGGVRVGQPPAELLVLNRLGIGYPYILAAWKVSQKLDCEPIDVLIITRVVSRELWQEAQLLLAQERRMALAARMQREHLLDQAINNLHRHRPQYSACKSFATSQLLRFSFYAILILTCFHFWFLATFKLLFSILTLFYSAVIVMRGFVIAGVRTPHNRLNGGTIADDADLPIYTALVALHDEEAQIDQLLRHLYQLDWPKNKLDIKLICEADDLSTLDAINRYKLPACFEVVVVPPALPRTKPKALNYALPFVKGEYIVLYDAEDRPVPGQLREAHARFSQGGPSLACVQAPLLIHNHSQNWLTAMFSIEYLTLFTGILPVLAKWKVPIPLGGTSNHFKASILKDVGGWDPYNVTEDADLGIRIFREGYHTETITTPTFEEAPPTLAAWTGQRTRWLKGWMQTLLVHGRNPLEFCRDLGLRNLLAYHLVLTSLVVSALLHPLLVFFFCITLFDLPGSLSNRFDGFFLTTSVFNLVGGYTTYGLLALLVLRSAGQNHLAALLITLPAYWMLISVAAWKAVVQLILKPHHWEKTPHGLASEEFHITDHQAAIFGRLDFQDDEHEAPIHKTSLVFRQPDRISGSRRNRHDPAGLGGMRRRSQCRSGLAGLPQAQPDHDRF